MHTELLEVVEPLHRSLGINMQDIEDNQWFDKAAETELVAVIAGFEVSFGVVAFASAVLEFGFGAVELEGSELALFGVVAELVVVVAIAAVVGVAVELRLAAVAISVVIIVVVAADVGLVSLV